MVFADAGQPEEAEEACRKSPRLSVQQGDVASQAATLAQLGLVYDNAFGRTEEAVALLQQAIDKFIETNDVAGEGRNRYNLTIRLRKLGRIEEAREQILRAIESKAQFGHALEPWKTWDVLADIEQDAGIPAAAAEAKRKAVASYFGYRRDGGENHSPTGRIALAASQSQRADSAPEAATFLERQAEDTNATPLLPFLRALQSVVDGSRDRTLAEDPQLNYTMAAEILLLIETLETPRVVLTQGSKSMQS